MSEEEPLKFWKEPAYVWKMISDFPGYRFSPRGEINTHLNPRHRRIEEVSLEKGYPGIRIFDIDDIPKLVERGLLFLELWPKPVPLCSEGTRLHCGFYNGDRTDFSISNLYYTTDENVEMAKSWELSDETAIFFIKEVNGETSWGFRNVMTCAQTLGMDPMDVVKLRTGRLTYKGYDWGFGLYD